MEFEKITELVSRTDTDLRNVMGLTTTFLSSFHQSITKSSQPGVRFVVENATITGNMFGATITSSYRPVVINDRFGALEWSFFAATELESVRLLTLYQWTFGELSHTPHYIPHGDEESKKDRIADVTNLYLSKTLVGLMLPELLKSRLFAPHN